jgi:diaminohydroxyphosphoribosylaminopyrimidine deaminase/5-amino-6-(5-phosphoribosylamino)uracil reductase
VDDTQYMRRALELARKAEGSVSPRPPVGAVIVSRGEIVGAGWTRSGQGRHAEVFALDAAGDRARGATMFVTLEPCAKQCGQLAIDAGIVRVVAAMQDPNPECDGRGFALLRNAGVAVDIGLEGDAAAALIEPFTKWITTGRPFVTLKLAMSLDGKVAAPDGTSQWITGEEARAEVHDLRRRVDAVVVGAGTVEIDDPQLTFRTPGLEGTQPLRVVIDSSGRTRPTARVFDSDAPSLVLTTDGEWTDIDVARLPRGEGGVDLNAALDELGRRGLCHVLVEAGPTLAASFAAARLVDRFIFYIAPKIIGGDAPGAFASGVKTIADAWSLDIERVTTVGRDIRIDARMH